jgi:signal peptidase I
MYPSIYVGDRIVVDKLAYDLRIPFTLYRIARWREPKRGDVVTFTSPEDDRLLVKRIIGVPGDVIELSANQLIVNGESANYEPLRADEVRRLPIRDAHRYRFLRESVLGNQRLIMLCDVPFMHANSFTPPRVPEGRVLVMGDNRDNSRDSRIVGFIDRDRILGRVRTVAFSLDYDRYYAPRLDRFFADLP